MLRSVGKMLLLLTLVVLTACGNSNATDEPKKVFQLKTHENQEVTIPGDKPVLLFFFTTYT